MLSRAGHSNTTRRLLKTAIATMAFPVLLAACQREAETAAPDARPVRTVTIEKREGGTPLTFTGRIEAEDEVTLSFRISGRILENLNKYSKVLLKSKRY